MNKSVIALGICFILSSCFSNTAAMTQESYATVQVGVPIQNVIKESGEPYSIRNKNGMEEYVYIERVSNGNELIYENHFILYVQDGIVVGKTVTQERKPPYDLIYQDDPNYPQFPTR